MEVYQPKGVVFLGIERGWRRPSFSGRIRDPLDWIRTFDWNFLNGIDRDESVYHAYEADMDQYFVVGHDGRLVYVSELTGLEQGVINIPLLVEGIEEALDDAPTPVRASTWSRLRRLAGP